MTEVQWQEPPPTTAGANSTKWRDIFAALRKRPGEWALVEVTPTMSTAANIRRGALGGSVAGEFESTSRKREDGRYDTYARYVGGGA